MQQKPYEQANRKKYKVDKKRLICSFAALVAIILVIVLAASFLSKHKKTKQVDAEAKEPKKVTTTQQDAKKEATKKATSDSKSKSGFSNPKIIKIDDDKWYLTCVNKDYGVESSYVPKLTKIEISKKDPRYSSANANRKLDYRVTPYYQKMYDAAKKDGIYLTPFSAYRSVKLQERNFNYYVELYKKQGYSEQKAKEKTATAILPPGTSEHNIGFAVDIVCADKSFNNTKEARWLDKHAHEYGFILRYPKDKVNVTEIMHESWHYRYVGVKAATDIKNKGVCLEEYLGLK